MKIRQSVIKEEDCFIHITGINSCLRPKFPKKQAFVMPFSSSNDPKRVVFEMCTKCRKAITQVLDSDDKRITSDDLSQNWHLSCFNCSSCKKSLFNEFYYQPNIGNDSANLVCEKCMDRAYGDDCQSCQRRIKRYSENEAKLSSKDNSKHWHDRCYRCWRCEKALRGIGHYSHDQIHGMYCATCYDDITGKICTQCKKRIFRHSRSEEQICAGGQKYWHKTCYKCSGCDKSLASTGHFPHYNGGIYCESCYDKFNSDNTSNQ